MDAYKHLASDRETDDPALLCVECGDVCSDEYQMLGSYYCHDCYYAMPEVVEGIEDEAEYDMKREA